MREYYKKIYKGDKQSFIKGLEEDIVQEKRKCVVTANPEIFMLADRIPGVKELLISEDTEIVADGIGIILGGKKLNYHMKERIPGVEICSELLSWAHKKHKSLYLFGAKPEVVKTLVRKVQRQYSGIRFCGYENGYVEDKDQVFERIAELKPDIILVALGAPKQELLIQKHKDKLEKGILIGVGGSFDVLSGMKKRAPKFFVKYNLEWLYRIATEPKRLKRFWNNNIKFLFAIRKEKHE